MPNIIMCDPKGQQYYVSPETGCIYPKILEQSVTILPRYFGGRRWTYCHEMVEATIRGLTNSSNLNSVILGNCEKLEKVCLPDLSGLNNSYMVTACTALKELQIGSIGNAMTGMYNNALDGCTNNDLVVTIYVNASSLADVPTAITDNAPFGATNATIVYRSSVTGEVLT